MSTPSITPAMILAAIGAIAGFFVAIGVVETELEQALLAAAATLVPIAFVIHDVLLRRKRAENATAIANAKVLVAEAKDRPKAARRDASGRFRR